MNVIDLPFNQFLGIKRSNLSPYLLMLEEKTHYANHMQTVHAAALFSLAEATAAQFMANTFEEDMKNWLPLLRKTEIKYHKPALGAIYGIADISADTLEQLFEQLKTQNRIQIATRVQLFDQNKTLVFTGNFDWFASKINNSIE